MKLWLRLQEFSTILGGLSIAIAAITYIKSEEHRRDALVYTAWQTIATAEGQPGNGGRIQALEFLNASPANTEYEYPGANWRRKFPWHDKNSIFQAESLEGVDLGVKVEDGAIRRGVYLQGIQLPYANLKNANLENADLREANLEGANLEGANLEGANLDGANLNGAIFTEANLRSTIIGTASMKGTSFRNANLEGASFFSLEDYSLGRQGIKGYSDLSETNSLSKEQLSSANFICHGTMFPGHININSDLDCGPPPSRPEYSFELSPPPLPARE
jgi:uncharacterized protein YjbI with pentapeptide repeats